MIFVECRLYIHLFFKIIMNINFVLIERRRFIETSFVAAELVVKISNLKFLINTIFRTTRILLRQSNTLSRSHSFEKINYEFRQSYYRIINSCFFCSSNFVHLQVFWLMCDNQNKKNLFGKKIYFLLRLCSLQQRKTS